MHAITPRLFSKDVYSVPLRLRALRLRRCVRLDRGGGGGGGSYWLPKCFQMYKKFSGHIHVFDPLSYTILLEDLLGIKKCRQKHGGSDAIALTTGP